MRSVYNIPFFILLSLSGCAGSKNYNSNSSNGNSYNYTGGSGQDGIYLSNCQNSVVEVTSVSIICDSPYTFYYGNGAHRNSQYCDYGDRASVTVYFTVNVDLGYDDVIYMTMGIYAAKSDYELLYSVAATELCQTFVGHECTQAGSYAFAFHDYIDYGYGDRSMFLPVVQFGFSTEPDKGYNLGGANIQCTYDYADYQQYDPWLTGNTTSIWGQRNGRSSAVSNYGLLIAVITLIAGFGLFASKKLGSQESQRGQNEAGLLIFD
jgi:hypothetical protein